MYTNAVYIIRKSEASLLISFFMKLRTIFFHRVIKKNVWWFPFRRHNHRHKHHSSLLGIQWIIKITTLFDYWWFLPYLSTQVNREVSFYFYSLNIKKDKIMLVSICITNMWSFLLQCWITQWKKNRTEVNKKANCEFYFTP